MSVVSGFYSAGVVVLAAVGQLNASFGQGCGSCVGVTSVMKSGHRKFLRESEAPVPWLGVSAPLKGVNVL